VTEGEAWAREILSELRAANYRPRAWMRFFVRSFDRAEKTRRQRRREHRQTLLVGTVGFAAWAAAGAFRPWLALVGALWWLLVLAMVDWHLGMLEDESGEPLRRLGLANLLSLVRAAVVPLLPLAAPALLAAIVIPAGATDAIDGSLARARGEETRLGAWLDRGADALLLSTAAVGAARHDLLPWWTAALVLARYTLQALGVALAYFVRVQSPRHVSVVGRVPGLVLFAGVALAALQFPLAVPLVSVGALGGVAALTFTVVRASLPEATA
jgi:cardiolipin synthase (CMP-forming)